MRTDGVSSGGMDQDAFVWDAKTGNQIGKPLKVSEHLPTQIVAPEHVGGASMPLYSHDGSHMLTARARQGHTKWITSLVWEPIHLLEAGQDVRRLATASKDASVRVWDAAANKVLVILTGHTASVTNVRWGGQV